MKQEKIKSDKVKQLFRFLKDEGVFIAWRKNFTSYRTIGMNEKLDWLGKSDSPLFFSFFFAHTPEGHNFWYDLARKAEKLYEWKSPF